MKDLDREDLLRTTNTNKSQNEYVNLFKKNKYDCSGMFYMWGVSLFILFIILPPQYHITLQSKSNANDTNPASLKVVFNSFGQSVSIINGTSSFQYETSWSHNATFHHSRVFWNTQRRLGTPLVMLGSLIAAYFMTRAFAIFTRVLKYYLGRSQFNIVALIFCGLNYLAIIICIVISIIIPSLFPKIPSVFASDLADYQMPTLSCQNVCSKFNGHSESEMMISDSGPDSGFYMSVVAIFLWFPAIVCMWLGLSNDTKNKIGSCSFSDIDSYGRVE